MSLLSGDHHDVGELDRWLPWIREAPRDGGRVELLVRRPAPARREVLEAGDLDVALGLVGDSWSIRPSRSSADGGPHPGKQVTLMSSRVIALLAKRPERWPLAGDQLYVDLDLSEDNLPAGTHLAIGDAVVEVSAQPHTVCARFADRFGADALRWIRTEDGRALRLRGLNAAVVERGRVRRGDVVTKVSDPATSLRSQ